MKGIFSPRWVIAVLPTLAALGPHALPLHVAGINMFAFRILILVMLAFSTPLTSGWGWWFNKLARRAMLLGIFWLLCGLLSLLWTPDLMGGMADILSIGFGFALLLVLLDARAHESQNLDLLRIGWVVAFVVAVGVAVWELVTGHHLSSEIYDEAPSYFDGTVAQSVLGRPNHFGMFLLVAMPFLLWSFYRARGAMKLIYAGCLVTAGVMILFTASRLSFIGFAVEVLFLLFVFDRRWYLVVLGLAAAIVGYFWWANAFLSSDLQLAAKFDHALNQEDGSIKSRIALTLNGLWMVYDTAGRGVGAAGYPDAVSDPEVPFRTTKHYVHGVVAHNLWVQIASEYNILTVVGLAALFLFITRLALQASRRRRGLPQEVRILGIITLVGLVGYLFYGVASGAALRHSVHWMFFASLVVVAAHLYGARGALQVARTREPQGRFLGADVSAVPGRRPGKLGPAAPAFQRASP